jgi:hypothetical protein
MKKLAKLVVVIIIIGTILVGCGGSSLSGRYVVAEDNRTLVFSGSDKVKFNDVEGTYKVEDGKITFIFKGNVQNYTFTKVSDSLVIDGVEYKKGK